MILNFSYDKATGQYIFAGQLMTKERLEAYLISEGYSWDMAQVASETDKQILYTITTGETVPPYFPQPTPPTQAVPGVKTPVGYILEPDKAELQRIYDEQQKQKQRAQDKAEWLAEYWDPGLMATAMVVTYMLLNSSMTDFVGFFTKLGVFKA